MPWWKGLSVMLRLLCDGCVLLGVRRMCKELPERSNHNTVDYLDFFFK